MQEERSENLRENLKDKDFYQPDKERREKIEAKKEFLSERETSMGKEVYSEEKRYVPSIEKITSSISSAQPTPFQQLNLLEEDKKLVDSLVSIVIKNPNLEKGLDEANKILNEEARRRKIKEDSELAYLIDAFHDELVQKLREREKKFTIDK